MRHATIERETDETYVKVGLNIDGSGRFDCKFGLPEKIIEKLGCFNDSVVQFLGVAKDWIINRTSISGDCFCYGVKNVCTPEKICSEFDSSVLCIGADALDP